MTHPHGHQVIEMRCRDAEVRAHRTVKVKTLELRALIEAYRQEKATANYWFEEANDEHNRAEKLRATHE